MTVRSAIVTALAAVSALSVLAAAPADDSIEIVDGCGDTGTYVLDENVEHPTPPATDVDTVDLRGRYASDQARTLAGMEVEVVTCGDPLAVSSGETIRVTAYAPADRLDGCDRSRVGVVLSRTVEEGSWSATLHRDCIVDGDCSLPLGLGGACGSTSSSELASVELPPDALHVDGRTFTVVIDRAELPEEATGFLVEGEVLSEPSVYGSSFAGSRISTGADPGVWVSLVETGEGRDHVLGEDRP